MKYNPPFTFPLETENSLTSAKRKEVYSKKTRNLKNRWKNEF